jgi:hypothetical protein
MEVICKRCQKIFTIKPYLLKEAGNFCSMACRRNGQNVSCNSCGKIFYKKLAFLKSNQHFCSRKCASEATYFKNGFTPWNKDLKGIHLSPHSEYKKGRRSLTKCRIGDVKIRKRKSERGERAYIKIAEPKKWELRAKLVWILHNGSIPKGNIIHHKDRNTLNDCIDNLKCLTPSEHLKEHFDEFSR